MVTLTVTDLYVVKSYSFDGNFYVMYINFTSVLNVSLLQSIHVEVCIYMLL